MIPMTAEHKHIKVDKLGLALSGICLVHCLGTPILLLVFPFLHGVEGLHSSFHWVAAILLVPLALYAVTQGYGHHKKKIVPLLAGVGTFLVLIGAASPFFIPHVHHHQVLWFTKDIVITIAGSMCLLACHTLNIWFCRNRGKKPACHNH